jgi:hypothetical protein
MMARMFVQGITTPFILRPNFLDFFVWGINTSSSERTPIYSPKKGKIKLQDKTTRRVSSYSQVEDV